MERAMFARLALFLFCLLGILEVAGQLGGLYALFFWYTILMHIIGGMASGLISLALIVTVEGSCVMRNNNGHIDRAYYITLATMLAFFTGIFFECSWLVYGGIHSHALPLISSLFTPDTALDIASATVGGFVAGIVAVFTKTKPHV